MSMNVSQIQQARVHLEHIKASSQQYCKDFPAAAREQMVYEFACMERVLTSLSQGRYASSEDMTVCVLAGLSSQDMLWTALEAVQKRLDDLQAEVQRFRADHEKLMLRQMANQTMNKVLRFCVPSIKTPYAARFASMDAIQRHKQHDAARVQAISSKYPHLVIGVSTLCDAAFPIAHPSELKDAEGKIVNPNIQLLQEVVDNAFKGTVVEGDVQEVLDCLKELQDELQEDLFVDTSKP